MKEVVEAWYRYITINGEVFTRINLPDFLCRDRWGLQLKPADHFRLLTLTLNESDNPKKLAKNVKYLALLGSQARVVMRLLTIHQDETRCLGCGREMHECDSDMQVQNFMSRNTRRLRLSLKNISMWADVFSKNNTKRLRLRIVCSWQINGVMCHKVVLFETGYGTLTARNCALNSKQQRQVCSKDLI